MELLELLFYWPLVFFYCLFLGYVIVWLIAFLVSRFQWDQEQDIEEVVCKAWGVALSLHLIATVVLMWLMFDDYFRAGQWIPKGAWPNLLVYPLILAVDVVFLAFLVKGLNELSRISARR